MTGKFVQQQLYTRERGGIFHATDGYDTIAISEGLDKAFVKKYLHPFCIYHSPKTIADSTFYPEAVTIFQPETGDLVIGQAVFVPSDFTGQRSTYFMHNYIIPPNRKDEWIKQPEKLFQLKDFKTSYDVELGKVVPERDIVSFGATDILSVKDELLRKLGISASNLKQLLFAVLSSIAGKKKVFISLNVPVQDYTKFALQLLELIYTYLPYAQRRKLGAITFSSEPEGKNYIHITFFEPGTLNVNDRSIEKQFIFDFAGGQISGVDIEGQQHEYLDFALHQFSEALRMDDFFAFAEMSLSGLPEVEKLELASYYQLTDLYLTLKYGNVSIYKKVGFLHSLLKFLQVNSDEKTELVELFLKLLSEEKVAADPNTALDYIHAVVFINTIVRSDEALSFILATLEYYQNDPLFHQLWKTIEQDDHTHKAIVLFINENPDYDELLELYLDERFKKIAHVEDLLNEIKIMLGTPYLLGIEKFKSVAIKKVASAITYDSFKAVLAVKDFTLVQQSSNFRVFKDNMLAQAKFALLRSIRLQELTVEDILIFGKIFTKELNVVDMKDVKVKDNYLITNALYQLISNPSQAGTYNLKSLTTKARVNLRSILQQLLRNNPTAEHFQLLGVAFETEYDGVDYQGLLEYMIRYSDDKTMLTFIHENVSLIDTNLGYRRSLRKYLISHPKSLWKKKPLRKELRSIRNSSFKKLLREVETDTASPLVKFLKKNGLRLTLAVVILGGVGGGAWLLLGDDTEPKHTKTSKPAAVETADEEKKEDTSISLDSFKVSAAGEPNQTFVLRLEGEQFKTIIGEAQPNGVNKIILTDISEGQWQLDLATESGISPFDNKLNLKKGLLLYSIEYDFTGDEMPEVVLVASDKKTESYVWVYSVNTGGLNGTVDPLKPILTGDGLSDVRLEGNKLIISDSGKGKIYQYSTVEQKWNSAQ